MNKDQKTWVILACCSIAAVVAYSTECIHGDIRQRGAESTQTPIVTTTVLEVCVQGNWTTVCHTGGWHSTLTYTENTRVACRQLGYREEGARFGYAYPERDTGVPRTATGFRQEICNGSEPRLIDCPHQADYKNCVDGVMLSCQLATCDRMLRLRGGRTATEGRVEVCRDGQWGTVCDDSWDRNDASVVCRQLGLSTFNQLALPSAYFGPGSARIHLSNLQCTGSEVALTDCIFDTAHQCSHNQDASVNCQPECINEDIRMAFNSLTRANTVEYCKNLLWNICDRACQDMNRVTQLGAYFCGSGEITHFLMNGSQLYECPISGAGEFLICKPTTQTPANLSTNCQKVWQGFEMQATSISFTVEWENSQYFENNAQYTITCSPEGIQLRSIVLNSTTSKITMENLPHSTTYECCATLHIGRYSTTACNNTATLADIIPSTSTTQTPCDTQNDSIASYETSGFEANDSSAIQGAALWVIIALGVLVAVLVLLLALATGAWLCSRNKIAALKRAQCDRGTQLNQDPAYDLPTSGSKPAKSGTEAEYEVVDREQPDGAELKQNPAYRVHKTHPLQANIDNVYETVDL